jgi:hypothetical protein
MGRLKELDGIIRDLRDLADRANDAADRLGEMLVNAQAESDEVSLRASDRRHWCGNPFSPNLVAFEEETENENLAYRH